MLWALPKGRVKVITNHGIVGTTTPGTAVTSNATTLLDGDVTELISAANNVQDSWGIELTISNTGAAAVASEACMDILIGGATDDVLIPALICGYSFYTSYFFPLHIPQGKRIAASFASVRTSLTTQVLVHLYGGSDPLFRVGRKVTTYGTQVNNARGQVVVPSQSGATATATEMTASTSEAHFAFVPGFQPATDTALLGGGMNVGIGFGSATEDRIGSWEYWKTTSEFFSPVATLIPAWQDLPAGSRLTILASNSGTNDAPYDALIYAVS